MRYNSEIIFNTEDSSRIFSIFNEEAGKKDRSEIKVEEKKDKIVFNISSKDITSLKASTNLILKSLEVYEKAEGLIKNG